MDDLIHVLVALDYNDEWLAKMREVSPRLQVVKAYPEVPESAWENVEVLYSTITFPPSAALAPKLKWVQLHSAGVEHFTSQPFFQQSEVVGTHASGIHAVPIGEYLMGMMLAWEFQLPQLVRDQQQKLWRMDARSVYSPRHLRGQTLGIVGYGSIGRELARLADAHGMKVLATKRDVMHPADVGGYVEPGTGDPSGDIPARIYPPEAIGAMVAECDYVAVLTPLTEKTRHMVNAAVIARMKPSAVLMNAARGAVIDEVALIEALKAHKIGGAVLDVFEQEPLPPDSPLWTLPNVILTPHISGASDRYDERAARVFIENLRRYVERRDLLNVISREHGY